MGSTSRLRTSAGVVLQGLQIHLWRRILLDSSSRSLKKKQNMREKNLQQRVLGCWDYFFFVGWKIGVFVYGFGFLQICFMLIYEIAITEIKVLTLS